MGELLIGWGSVELTPDRPVELQGQMYERIAEGTRDPLYATAMALEREDKMEQAVIVACDLIGMEWHITAGVREQVRVRMPDLHPESIILTAVHSHTAPRMRENKWVPSLGQRRDYSNLMSPEAYSRLAVSRIADAVCEAWQTRKQGQMGSAEGYAAIGHNRRVQYDDHSAIMYGQLNTVHFQKFGGVEDHRVDLMFTYNEVRKLTGVLVNVACPAQVLEQEIRISADYLGEVRRLVKQEWGKEVSFLGLIGAAGDTAPYDLIRMRDRKRDAEEELRRIANTLFQVIRDAWEEPGRMIDQSSELIHKVEHIQLPVLHVTMKESHAAHREYEKFMDIYNRQTDPIAYFRALDLDIQLHTLKNGAIVMRHERMRREPFYSMELHVLRIGETVLVTNPFELYTEYGLQIKARSAARQTFVVQLACDYAGYLPTSEAIASGGYSTGVSSVLVGAEGGRILVEQSVRAIASNWYE
ncbi:hypothetical protein [Paenibacillus chungangensis]|uniref:Neutral/alkaline non-lysosomal ceramidase N-terminal domain-containing protein n=1 Tax=Paenibacillus chungangensis TaxID=696535 RepID=A0ABW3HSW1_9BACL